MKKRKENMNPDYRKTGYLKVGRSVLRAFFAGERESRELSKVLLCVETFAYFAEGQVWLNDKLYFCHPGEWITSYTEMEELTKIDRRQVKKYLLTLEKQHFLILSDVGHYKRIALINYEQSVEVHHEKLKGGKEVDKDPHDSGAPIWDAADAFYNPNYNQKGGVN